MYRAKAPGRRGGCSCRRCSVVSNDAPPVAAASGVAVNMYGRANNVYQASTGPDGQYAAFVKAGHYRVLPESKSVPSKGRVKFTPDSSDVHAPANGKATADFKLDGGFRTIYLASTDRRYHVRARTGYFAPKAGQ